MDERIARATLRDAVQDNDVLHRVDDYIFWEPDSSEITLDGVFTLDDLEAMVWWMINKSQ